MRVAELRDLLDRFDGDDEVLFSESPRPGQLGEVRHACYMITGVWANHTAAQARSRAAAALDKGVVVDFAGQLVFLTNAWEGLRTDED